MYALLHYVDQTQTNAGSDKKDTSFVNNVTQSNLRRYWHSDTKQNTPYQKINTPKEPVAQAKNVSDSTQHKQDEDNASSSPDISIFQQPVSKNIKKTVVVIESEDLNRVVELESSDDDEVIEVALPPKPTITIESSDEDTVALTIEAPEKKAIEKHHESKTGREATSSPVPSVVSSVSDDFIRSDCIALNISSKHANKQSFDFSLHGADLIGQTPTRKKKKKRNKDTSTPNTTPVSSTPISVDECFATPKSKAKNKRQRTKTYCVTEKSVPNPDVYDSDSNQSACEGTKNQNDSVTDKSLPKPDVYENDATQTEVIRDSNVNVSKEANSTSESSITATPKTTKKTTDTTNVKTNTSNKQLHSTNSIDLTEPEASDITINEHIVMGNVSGFSEIDSYDENTPINNLPTCGSTKIPAILNEDLDFDNLKGNEKVCKRRQYSLTTLRAEMEKFYNESWGGEDFNHREIQKNMSSKFFPRDFIM